MGKDRTAAVGSDDHSEPPLKVALYRVAICPTVTTMPSAHNRVDQSTRMQSAGYMIGSPIEGWAEF